MSIYSTGWEIKVPVMGYGTADPRTQWLSVWVQAVPAHIGHPLAGYATDPFADFLPPVVDDYDPDEEDSRYRAFVLVAEGFCEKDGQRYVNPIATLTPRDYNLMTWERMLALIHRRLRELLPPSPPDPLWETLKARKEGKHNA